MKDALGDLVRSTSKHHPTLLQVGGARSRRALHGTANFGRTDLKHAKFMFEIDGFGLSVIFGDEAVNGYSYIGRIRPVAAFAPCAVIGTWSYCAQ